MTDYTYFDLFSILAVSLSVLIAYFRGVTQEIFAILNWVFSGILAIFFAPILSPHLGKIPIIKEIIYQNCELEILISIALCFILSLIILSLFTPIFSRAIQKSPLKNLDSSLGVLFGLIRGLLIVCLVLLAHNKLLEKSDQLSSITESSTILLTSDFMKNLETFAPDDLKYWLTARYTDLTKSSCPE